MTRGEEIAEDVRAYLFTNGVKKAFLSPDTPSKLLAELADRTLARLDAVERKKKRLATEEDWINELEKEPALAGINVRLQLAKAQFWCKQNGRTCTKRFFVNWLNKAERVVSAGGAQQARGVDPDIEPEDWKTSRSARIAIHASEDTWENMVREGWIALSRSLRISILRAL